jgi:ZIP family zinc transporter
MGMEIIGPLILSLIAGLSTVLGSLFILLKINKVGEFITFSLSLSFTIMILVSVVDLLPNSVKTIVDHYKLIYGVILSFLTFLLGYLSINRLNKRIEEKSTSTLYKIGVLSMISLMMHNFPEGIAVFMSAYSDMNIGIKLCIAIMLHNIPEGIVISVPLHYSGVSRAKTIKYTLISGLAEPLGAILCYILLRKYINDVLLSYILVFVAGLMINLSLNEILKEIINYNKKTYILYGIVVGIVLFSMTLFI